VKQAQSGLRLLARPPSVEVVGLVENVSESEIQYEMHSLEGVKESIARVHEQVRILEEDSKAKSLPQFPIVTFLGTGSTTPSKYRNVSGILLETHPGKQHLNMYSEHLKTGLSVFPMVYHLVFNHLKLDRFSNGLLA
jgi:hypothetical protein